MLNFPEEIMLLLLDDRNGSFLPIPEWSTLCALSGAVLMDLALADRIDTDPESLVLVDKQPTGDPPLDPALKRIAAARDVHDARCRVGNTAACAAEIREGALVRLVENGVPNREEDRFVPVFRSRRYPTVDGRAKREVRLRIMSVPLPDESPGQRDIVIVCNCDACGIFSNLLSPRKLKRASSRIGQVRKMDLIGQAAAKSVREIQPSPIMAAHPVYRADAHRGRVTSA